MDFGQYIMPVSLVIALAICFVLKACWEGKVNRWLPIIAAAIGLVVTLWVGDWKATPELVAQGLISGLAATGLYEAFAQWLKNPVEHEWTTLERKDEGDEQVVVDENVEVDEEVL